MENMAKTFQLLGRDRKIYSSSAGELEAAE
jgi:hypothetical protein